MSHASRDRRNINDDLLTLGRALIACIDALDGTSVSTGSMLSRLAIALARVAVQQQRSRR